MKQLNCVRWTGAVLACTILLHAQQVASPPVDAETLAKYDVNRNGRLDPDEMAAREADLAEAIVMSPFEVVSEDRGYQATNTMSGTRMNSKLEDIASSISVVTKEQMSDFGLLDINDIFLYEAGTEGFGTYTEFEFDRNGTPMDSSSLEPGSSNRVRGIGAANTAYGNFETSGRVSIDPINVESIEISRGPNSNIFGLGNASGTVNIVPTSANLTRDMARVQLRGDSYGGYRGSLEINRVLLKDKLALRGSAVYQNTAYVRKPSGVDENRLNGYVKYRPFKATTLSASYESFRKWGTMTNATLPRDTLTAWRAAGSPTYNNKTRQMRINGVLTGPALGISTLPSYLINTTGSGRTNSLMLVDNDGSVLWWGQPEGTLTTNPLQRNQSFVGGQAITNSPVEFIYGYSSLAGMGLFQDLSLTDQSVYDWTEYNLAGMNYLREETRTTHVNLEHMFLNTARHTLGFQAGYFREDSDKYRRDFAGGPTSQRQVGALYVDVNEFLPDGSPNPNLLRPYLGLWQPASYENPLLRQTYRAQLAYRLDLRNETGKLRWLGMHQLLGYGEYKDNVTRRLNYVDVIRSSHPWITAAEPAAAANNNAAINYYRFYVGDNVGQNVDYGSHSFSWGDYPYRWGTVEAISTAGVVTTQSNIRTETATLGPGVRRSGGGSNNRQILKTQGLILQSYLFNDRVITTFGVRKDHNYNRPGQGMVFLPGGVDIDREYWEQWAEGDWNYGEGPTRTAGVVVKPLRWLSLHYNQSDSFQPEEFANDLLLQPVTDPAGEGKDYGFSLNLLDGKLIVKVNKYETLQIRRRNGQSGTLANRLRGIDFDTPNRNSTPFFLIPQATGWVQRANPTWSADQVAAEVSRITQIDPEFMAAQLNESLTETEDASSEGEEIEIHYNPSRFWTMKMNVTHMKAVNAKIAPGIENYINERMPVWQSIIDPETGQPWWTSDYDATAGVRTAESFFLNSVIAPLAIAKSTEGKRRTQTREYKANFLTSYRLAGLTEHRFLKNLTLGGALRWESKASIGYWGVDVEENLAAKLPVLELDRDRPIYDKARLYADVFLTYRTRFFADKVNASFQLNVRNLQESGRLQAIKVNPDGVANVYRIIDPRQFILTASFDL